MRERDSDAQGSRDARRAVRPLAGSERRARVPVPDTDRTRLPGPCSVDTGPAPGGRPGPCSGGRAVSGEGARPVWNRLQCSSPIWSETLHGSVRRRPDGCGLRRGLPDRAADIVAAQERSESLRRSSDVIAHTHPSHAPR